MNKIPFLSMFSQHATGISIHGNDLVVTTLHKKLITYFHNTARISDFMLKDAQQLKAGLKPQLKIDGEIILSWPRGNTIVREIDFPNTNIKELKEALGYQLESFIPFNNDDVYFDIHALYRIGQDTKVLIVAVKKAALDHVLTKLQAIEIIPTRVIISPFAFLPLLGERKNTVVVISKEADNYVYNLYKNYYLVLSSVVRTGVELTNSIKMNLPEAILLTNVAHEFPLNELAIPMQPLADDSESYGAAFYGLSDYACDLSLVTPRKKRLNPQISLLCFLTSFLILFAFLIPYIHKINNMAILRTVNTQIKSIKKDVIIVEKLQERIAELDDAISRINNIKGKYIARIDILSEFSKLLPSDSWIKGITLEQNTFDIEGDAVSSTNLIPILENSPLFSGVGLASPVTKTQSGRERFRIKGNIEK